MKYRITKAAFDKLSDELKLEYKSDGDSHYKLVIEGQPSEEGSEALRNALDREKADNKELRDQLNDLNTKLTDAEKKLSEGDPAAQREVTRLTKKIETLTAEHEGKLAAKDKIIVDGARDRTVSALAAKISTSPGVISPHIASRLEVTIDPDTNEPKIGIKGKDGKIDPALTIDKLGEEFVANPEFKAIIRASGAGGTRPPVGGGGAPQLPGSDNSNQNQPVDLMKADNKTFIETIRARHAARENAGQTT